MKVKSFAPVIAGSAIAWTFALAWVGCVGDAPSTPSSGSDGGDKAAGTLGGSCFANFTCNGGLDCFEDVCIPHDTGGTSGGTSSGETPRPDGGVSDADADAATDDGGCHAAVPVAKPGPICAGDPSGACGTEQVCCTSGTAGGTCTSTSTGCTPPTTPQWTCSAATHCAVGAPTCCLQQSDISLLETSCPPGIIGSGAGISATCVSGTCNGTVLCATNSDCFVGKCVPVRANVLGAEATVGICQ